MSYLVRTDFTDDERWSALCAAIETGSEADPIDEPFLEYVPDPGLQGADLHAVQGAFPDPGETGVLYVPDAVSCGESFGLVWAIADEGLMPALNLSRSPRQLSAGMHAYSLLGHAVYGSALECARMTLSRRDLWEVRPRSVEQELHME